MWKVVCNGPTGQHCHIYDSNGAEVRCLSIDLKILPGQPITAVIGVLVDQIDIQIDQPNIETVEHTMANLISAQKTKDQV
jgi:hypothetical protein